MGMFFNSVTGQMEDDGKGGMDFSNMFAQPTGLPEQPAQPAPATPAQKKPVDPVVAQYLQQKMQPPTPMVEDQFSPEKYKAALAKSQSEQDDTSFAQMASGIGAALAGRDPGSVDNYYSDLRKNIQDRNVGEFNRQKAAQSSDPKSQKSIAFRKLVESTMPNIAKSYGPKWDLVTEEDGKNILNFGSMRENIEARKQTAEILKGTKAAEKTDKLRTTMNEIEDRRQNINANLEQLKSMVDDKGTFESFGSHNQDMDRLIEQTATDMAKLMDPSSVARPAEVEAVKKTLIKPGFANTNATAKDILNNFQSEVDRRASSAYKIRGLEAPTNRPAAVSAGAASTPASKVVNGKKYIKVPGGWKAE